MAKIGSFTNEQDVELEAIDMLVSLGYQDYRSESYKSPNEVIDDERCNDHKQIILRQRLRNALERNTPGLSDSIYNEAVRQFYLVTDGPDLMENNHQLHRLIIEGAKVKVSENGQDHTYVLKPIDFDNVETNDFVVTNQFTMEQGQSERRPDITIFINGLPLITFELKNQANENVGIEDAYAQLQTYKQDISDYMAYILQARYFRLHGIQRNLSD